MKRQGPGAAAARLVPRAGPAALVAGLLVLVAGLLVLVGCSGSAGPRGSPSSGTPAAAGLVGALSQNREDEVRGVVAIRLTATTRPLTVRRIAVDWSGLRPAAPTTPDYPLSPGVPADLPVPYGAALCGVPADPAAAVPDDPPTAVLLVDDAGAAREIRLALTVDGDLLTRLFAPSCRRQALDAAVEVRLGGAWARMNVAGRPALRGAVELTRRRSDAPLRVTAIDGSVLLSIRPAAPARDPLLGVARGQSRGSLPVVVASSGRCDGHALGESKKTYVFTVAVDAGAGPVAVDVTPAAASARAAMWRVITATCTP